MQSIESTDESFLVLTSEDIHVIEKFTSVEEPEPSKLQPGVFE